MVAIIPDDGWESAPWCERCGGPVPRGYRFCKECHWDGKAAMSGALGPIAGPTHHITHHTTGAANDVPQAWWLAGSRAHVPMLRCDFCDEGTDQPYITGDQVEDIVCYCPDCLLRVREVMLAVYDSTHARHARYTDWPGQPGYVALQTTERALSVPEDERHPWTWVLSQLIIEHNRRAAQDSSGATRHVTVEYSGHESDGDWLALHAPEIVRMRLRLLDQGDAAA